MNRFQFALLTLVIAALPFSVSGEEQLNETNPQIKDFALYTALLIHSHCDSVVAQQKPSLEEKKKRGIMTEYGLQDGLVSLSELCSGILLIELDAYVKSANQEARQQVRKKFEKSR